MRFFNQGFAEAGEEKYSWKKRLICILLGGCNSERWYQYATSFGGGRTLGWYRCKNCYFKWVDDI